MAQNLSNDHINLTMLTDFYEITMANGYFTNGFKDTIGYFDMFFRKVPDGGGFAIMAGVEQLVNYLSELSFTQEDIDYLRSKRIFREEFLDYLKNFKFTCDVWAVPEGTPIFPGEPIVTVRGPVIQAQFVETMVLLSINHQSLIATKTNRIVRAADGRSVMEFGSRRAQGFDGAIYGARAAYIGGCVGTACTISDRRFGVPALGTMAHSWVQLFDSEYEAFKAYAEEYPHNCTLLVDTYNVLKSGVPNAIRVFNEVLVPQGFRPAGIRIDSGDITYHSFGVGERLITSSSEPVFGGVYKLAAVEKPDGTIVPKIKISENVAKITTPCFKEVWRIFDRETDKAIADVITLNDEVIDDEKPYTIFDPNHTWKRKTVENFRAVRLRTQLFKNGECLYQPRALSAIRAHCLAQVDTLWEEVTRFENPHSYYVDLSQKLWDEKNRLLSENQY